MTASTCPPGYQRIELSKAKVELFVDFLYGITEGPAEAIAMLHQAIAIVDALNTGAEPRSAEQLGQELTFGLLAAGLRQ